MEQVNMEKGSNDSPSSSSRFLPKRSDRKPKGMALIIMARPDSPIIRPTLAESTPCSGR